MASFRSHDRQPDRSSVRADPVRQRRRMVRRDIAGRGVRDPAVLEAMGAVPRECFTADRDVESAYDDRAQPIGSGQTISQPFVVALMAEAAELGPDDKVLEIGTGSGYGAAVLADIAGEVWTIERHESLARRARGVLEGLGIGNVHVVVADGAGGFEEQAPYDAIVVTAAAPIIPRALLSQLADGGRLIMPVGPLDDGQEMVRVRRDRQHYSQEDLGAVRFVPLVSDAGAERSTET